MGTKPFGLEDLNVRVVAQEALRGLAVGEVIPVKRPIGLRDFDVRLRLLEAAASSPVGGTLPVGRPVGIDALDTRLQVIEGAPRRIAQDSTSLHPDAWFSDDFDYPDTATWLAAARAKPTWQRDSNTAEMSIDPTVQFGGHNTLRFTSIDVNGTIGKMQFAKPIASQILWLRCGVLIPAVGGHSYRVDWPTLATVPDAVPPFQEGPTYYVERPGWEDWWNGDLVLTDAGVLGNIYHLVMKLAAIDASNVRANIWINGTPGVAPIDMAVSQSGFRVCDLGCNGYGVFGADTGRYSSLLHVESLDGDGLSLPPYTGLG